MTHKKGPPTRRKRKTKKELELKPIMGVHSKHDVQVMKEINPPVDKKTAKKLKSSMYKRKPFK